MSGAVLYVHPSDEGYGADRVLLAMVEGSLANRRAVKVLLPDDSEPGWLSARLEDLGVDFERGPLAVARRRYLTLTGSARYCARLLSARRFIRRSARAFDAAIVHLNTSALLAGVLIGHPNGARTAWHVHEIVTQPRFLAAIFRRAPRTADRVVAVSDAVRRNLLVDGVGVVHNGIEPRTSAPSPNLAWLKRPVVAYVGRLSEWKGYLTFLEAAARLSKVTVGATFVIAGSPPPGEEWRTRDLTERVDSASLGDRIHLLGFWDDPASLLDVVDVAVVPSLWPDPLPTVVLEAMRAGCAVVATSHGGVLEMIDDTITGLLVPPGDVPALAAAIARLLDDERLRLRLAEAGRQRVLTDFNVQRFRADIEGIHRSLER